MSTGRKASADVLWQTSFKESERPSLDLARRRLGGTASTDSRRVPGSLVVVSLRSGAQAKGILLWETERYSDVWFEDGVARRARAETVSPLDRAVPASLTRIAGEMRIFMSFAEGDRVYWQRSAEIADGCIVEKCRYGAIVVTGDGKVVAVGFRKLWPAAARGVA
jgi:hypothetical protein